MIIPEVNRQHACEESRLSILNFGLIPQNLYNGLSGALSEGAAVDRCGWWQKRREAGSGRGWEEQIPKNDYEAKLFNKEESFRKSKKNTILTIGKFNIKMHYI